MTPLETRGYTLPMTKSAKHMTVTPKQYAKFIGRSLSTVYRRLSALARKNEARKRSGKWLILVDVRAWKAALVDQDRAIGKRILAAGSWDARGVVVNETRARRAQIHEALILIGGGSIIHELGRAKMLVGVQGARAKYLATLAEIDRLIAA